MHGRSILWDLEEPNESRANLKLLRERTNPDLALMK
jgi:hypothetical protein